LSLVIDASVTLAWCFEDEQTPQMMALLERIAAEGASAPQLWPLEALNALLTAQRRGRISAAERRELLALLHQLPIEIDGETAAQAWSAIQAIAETHGLTAYDAAYLELALRLGVPLATNDRPLAMAARSLDVPLLLPT
jgi:predicted nucleic acid-binding protein